MILIHEPCLYDQRQLQVGQSGYYWSRLAVDLFRAYGLISVERTRPDVPSYGGGITEKGASTYQASIGADLILRETPPPALAVAQVRVCEGPLHPQMAAFLGKEPQERFFVDEAALLSDNGTKIGVLQRRRLRIRTPENKFCEYVPDDPYWRKIGFEIEIWPEPDPAANVEVLARLALPDGRIVPAVLREGMTLFLTFPLFDVAGSWLAFPRLEERYAGILGSPPFGALISCLTLIERHLLSFGVGPLVFARPWPEPFTWALSIRHDYDRPISDASWQDLIAVYQRHGIRASIGILDYLRPSHVLDMIGRAGHEIQLHCFAQTELDLRNHTAVLSSASHHPIEAATIHGGPAGVGFRGDHHLAFFERVGFSIAENYGVRSLPRSPLARIVEGVPEIAVRLAAPPFHFSLDSSTRPGDHRLAYLLKAIPAASQAGEYVVVMNHPDIHREALYTLLESLDLSQAWRPTIHEAMRFARGTRTGARVVHDSLGRRIVLAEPLPQQAIFEVRTGMKERLRIAIPPGQTNGSLSP